MFFIFLAVSAYIFDLETDKLELLDDKNVGLLEKLYFPFSAKAIMVSVGILFVPLNFTSHDDWAMLPLFMAVPTVGIPEPKVFQVIMLGDEEKNLSVDHQKLLLKPSGSKTYRVTQENERTAP